MTFWKVCNPREFPSPAFKLLVAAIALARCAPGQPDSSGGGMGSTPPPTIASFSATSTAIAAGNSTTLRWTANNATSLSINNGVGAVSGTEVSVTPAATTTYTLTATNVSGSTTASFTVTVNPVAQTARTPISINAEYASALPASGQSGSTWLGYLVHNAASGTFNFALSAGSSGTNKQADLYVDGGWIGAFTVTNTGGNSSFATTSTLSAALSVDTHAVKSKRSPARSV